MNAFQFVPEGVCSVLAAQLPPEVAKVIGRARGNAVFLESIFIDQATLNGTRPNSPAGVKPARPLMGRYL